MINSHFIIISILLLLPLIIIGTNVTNKSESHVNKTEQVTSKLKNVSPDFTHSGREHVTEKTLTLKNISTKMKIHKSNVTNDFKTSDNITDSTTSANKSTIHNVEIPHMNTNNSSTINKNSLPVILEPSTIKPLPVAKPKKPLVTTHDYDQMDSIPKKGIAHPHNIMNIDTFLTERKVKRSNYVVPIVAIILSVPLVAAVISILYKKGKDWWVHRNYRRMDYLIEGLYNS